MISPDRQSHLAHLIVDALWDDDLVDYSDDELAVRVAKKAIVEFVKADEMLDKLAKDKVASLRRGVTEGSPEWDILYKKYYEEELQRRGKN
jgi:uncharacterized protein